MLCHYGQEVAVHGSLASAGAQSIIQPDSDHDQGTRCLAREGRVNLEV